MEKEKFIEKLNKAVFCKPAEIKIEKLSASAEAIEAELTYDGEFYMLCSTAKSFVLRNLSHVWLYDGKAAEEIFSKLSA